MVIITILGSMIHQNSVDGTMCRFTDSRPDRLVTKMLVGFKDFYFFIYKFFLAQRFDELLHGCI